jgi:ABC-type dipeptide/oligopeptide/nickel transport system permease component
VASQFVDWLGRAARFDFGVSLVYHRPVAELVRQRALNTSILALAALLLATAIGLPAGIVTGSRRRGVLPSLIRAASIVLLSLPSLITSLVLVMVAARRDVAFIDADACVVLVGMRTFPPYADVVSAIRRFKQEGFRLAALTNSPPAVAEAQLTNSASLLPDASRPSTRCGG